MYEIQASFLHEEVAEYRVAIPMDATPIYTKESLILRLREIKAMGWLLNPHPNNNGSIGDLLESLLGIKTNNLPLPNAGEWELKTQRLGSNALVTFFHLDPSPKGMSLVTSLLLPYYGWRHTKAGLDYPVNEQSFRQTISGDNFTDRGFRIVFDTEQGRMVTSFDAMKVGARHSAWLKSVEERVGNLEELSVQPYWDFRDLEYKAGLKLHNSFFVQAQQKKQGGNVYVSYERIMMLQEFDISKLIVAITQGDIKVDYDARSGHNHGTKFRIRQSRIPDMYKTVQIIE